MSVTWEVPSADLDRLARIAELVALKTQPGDVIELRGDLGAGKTTFARALIRALLGEAEAEIPSPTFPIVQSYATPRLPVAHFDLYRLEGPDDLAEVGFEEAVVAGLVLVEWPERAAAEIQRSADRLIVTIEPAAEPERRHLRLVGLGSFAARLERLRRMNDFLAAALPGGIRAIAYLQGDASSRAYARITDAGGRRHVLMDAPRMPDGPPVRGGLPYSRIAHLAEDVRPFVAVGMALERLGLSVPHIHFADLDAGLLLLEDLGDLTFGRALAEGFDQRTLYLAAVDALVVLRANPPPRELPLADGTRWRLPRFDRAALEIEIGLLLDWYWPHAKGGPAPALVKREFEALWGPLLDRMLAAPAGLFLRDVHSPNLFWLPEREGVQRVGLIDFQDALAEHWAYDLASLLQDARLDVPEALEREGIERYCQAVARSEPNFDRAAFEAAYALFGAQRNTRLIGLWVRLLVRDGKPGYMQHMPRTWAYLARNLAHPGLAALRSWYEREFPGALG